MKDRENKIILIVQRKYEKKNNKKYLIICYEAIKFFNKNKNYHLIWYIDLVGVERLAIFFFVWNLNKDELI